MPTLPLPNPAAAGAWPAVRIVVPGIQAQKNPDAIGVQLSRPLEPERIKLCP